MGLKNALDRLRGRSGDVLLAVGSVVVAGGVGMYSLPAGVITFGVALLAAGVLVELGSGAPAHEGAVK